MKLFDIAEIREQKYSYLIFSLSFLNPLEEKDKIENELSKKNYIGKLLIDLLLSNGNTSNRFLEVFFDGQKIIFEDNENEFPHISENIRKFSSEFYRKNYNYVESNFILNNVIKNRLKSGQIL